MKLENQSDFYLLYKPNSWTSQDLCTFFKKKYNFKKVGHSGTLDPSAEGLMLIATNKYTKFTAINCPIIPIHLRVIYVDFLKE